MRTHSKRTYAAVVMAVMVVTARPVAAQSQSGGWPDADVVAKAPKVSAAVKPAAAPAKAAAAPKPAAAPKAKAAPAAKPAPAPAPAAALAANVASAEMVTVLQQQAEILKRLATELEAQRAVIKQQEEKIKAIETKATEKPSASAAPAAKVPPPPPPPAILVDTGGVKLRVSGLFQGWYTASDQNVADTFRLRRAELKFSGDVSPRIKWTVMVDPAKTLGLTTTTSSMSGQTVVTGSSISQSGRLLQDAFVSLNWKPALSVEVGQQKLPLGMEGTSSSGKLDVVERALFMTDKARGGGYADIRDFGMIVRGKTARGQVEYSGGFFNGLGESFNDTDRNEDKPIALRVVAKPTAVKGLHVGASIAREGIDLFDVTARERQGVELAWSRGFFGFKSEYMGGRDAAVTRQGGYAQVSAKVTKALTTVARFDTWDPDTRSEGTSATVTERDWIGGFTYILHPSGVWLQMNYVRKTFGEVSPSRNVFMTNVQTAW